MEGVELRNRKENLKMDDLYVFTQRVIEVNRCFKDELSKHTFQARFLCDIDPSPEHIKQLSCLRSGYTEERAEFARNRLTELLEFARCSEKLVIYGTASTARILAAILQRNGIEMYGYCGRRAAEFPNGIDGKPVFEPKWLEDCNDSLHIIVASTYSYKEIFAKLAKMNIPDASIFRFPFSLESYFFEQEMHDQYFEFLDAFLENTAFVDAGSLNGITSIEFATLCKKQYSKIYAFEPDPGSYAKCKTQFAKAGLHNVELVQAGLAAKTGKAVFAGGLSGGSHIIDSVDDCGVETDNDIEIATVKLDDVAGEETIGFIKMDIEGAEYDALHGAKRVIERDKPLLAICVYHKPGDVLAITEYLHRLVPSYQFILRHYGWEYGLGMSTQETVLYAFVSTER